MEELKEMERYYCNVVEHNKEPRLLMCPKCRASEIAKAKQKEAEEIYNWFWESFAKSNMNLNHFKKIKSYLFKRKELQEE